ncbi:D(2) dopamine receptor A-like [Patiria miniata]|uniref:G-protein coupled receptors family 1 profile domain-containing protein n=1 Tax=Patiria miniata TaxID=46514 RepID=A0A914AXX2_PATMI|nr:D(2) dopamine receptor A-like [Patiria miniata]
MAILSALNTSVAPSISGADNSCDTSILAITLFVRAVVFVIGVPGNCLILRVYWTKARKTSTHILIMALASTDLYVCLILSISIVGLALECGGNGEDFSMLIRTFWYIGIVASFCITAAIAVDRYDCICRPQRRYCTPRRAKVAAFVIVLFSVLFCIPGSIRDYLYPPMLGIDLLVPIAENIAMLIALVTIGICYGNVYAAVLRHVKVGAIPERTSTQDDQVATKIDKDRTIPPTQSALPKKNHLSAINNHMAKRGNGSDRNSKCSTQPPSDAPVRIEANTSVVDNEVSTVINLADTSSTPHQASTSRLDILEVPQNTNGNLVNPAERDFKVGPQSVSQAVSEQDCSKGGDKNLCGDTNTLRRHAPKRMGGAVLQRKTTKMLFITSVVFLLTWLPDLIDNAIHIAYLAGSNIDPESTFYNIWNWLSFTIFINNAINPLIYGLANKRFRKDCVAVFRKMRR